MRDLLVPKSHTLALNELENVERTRLRVAYGLASTWPTLSYLLLLVLPFGIGGIAFKLVPLLIAQRFNQQILAAHATNGLSIFVRQVLHLQLGLAVGLEVVAVLLVLCLGASTGADVSGALMIVCWSMHTVIGARALATGRTWQAPSFERKSN